MKTRTPAEEVEFWQTWFTANNWPYERRETDRATVFLFPELDEETGEVRDKMISIPRTPATPLTRERLLEIIAATGARPIAGEVIDDPTV
jgi:hypothetical protein